MRGLGLLALIPLCLIVAACGSDAVGDPAAELSPEEQVVQAWGDALNAGDDEAAAALFVERPLLLDGGILPTIPRTFEALVAWHEGLQCGGEIIGLAARELRVTATFRLADRPGRRCPVPGYESTVVFRLEDGLIRTWDPQPPGVTADDG